MTKEKSSTNEESLSELDLLRRRVAELEKFLSGQADQSLEVIRELKALNRALENEAAERRKAEGEARASEERYQRLFNQMLNGFALQEIILDEAGKPVDYRFLQVNPTFEKLTGLKAEQVLGRTYSEVLAPPDPWFMEVYGRVALTGQPAHFERFSATLGRHLEVTAFCPQPGQFATVFLDVTARKEAEARLIESERLYRELYEESRRREQLYESLLNCAPDAVAIYNLEGEAVYVNPAFTRLFGLTLPEVQGRRIDFVPEKEKARTMAAIPLILQGQPLTGFETRRRTKDGRILDVTLSSSCYYDHAGRPAGIVVFLRDTTEAKRVERILRQAQKMEAIGTLASGVAHDFNNLLQGMSGYLELIQRQEGLDPDSRAYLGQIEDSIRRAADLIRRLLAFSSPAKLELKAVDLNREIVQMVTILERTLPKMIRIETRLAPDLRPVSGDPIQLEQVVMNLAANSRDAMPEGGTLLIEAENVPVPEAPPGLSDRPLVRLRVSDTGSGMDQHTREHIFEPFFTTKGVGKGTGLGLSMVYGVIKSHGGTVTCQSGPSQGTVFEILLPARSKDAPGRPRPTPKKAQAGVGTILVVDDDANIREVTTEMLKAAGYRTLSAESGETALDIYRNPPRPIDLVILDLGMPGMGGAKCFEELIRLDPAVKVLIASGYGSEAQAINGFKTAPAGFLAKPYRSSEMLKKVREVLET